MALDSKKQTGTGKTIGKIKLLHDVTKIHQEEYRHRTFMGWPKEVPLPTELAKAGFYYVGISDRVRCFSCGGQIDEWEDEDTAMGEHKRHFPKCKFVRGLDKTNVPMKKKGQKKTSERQIKSETHTKLKTEKTITVENIHKHAQDVTDGIHRQETPLYSETYRLETFRDRWPRSNPMKPFLLARAGFFYTGIGDRVKCFSCGLQIEEWEDTDVPSDEHAKCRKECSFISGTDLRNIPRPPRPKNEPKLDQDEKQCKEAPRKEEPKDTGEVEEQFKKDVEKGEMKVEKQEKVGGGKKTRDGERREMNASEETTAPEPQTDFKHPSYVGVGARQKSLMAEDCPFRMSIFGSTPTSMASAGFFYTGPDDECKTHCCDICLRKWESSIDPWSEHAMWSPSCRWLIDQKGTQFVKEVATACTEPVVLLSCDLEKLNIKDTDEDKDKDKNNSMMESTAGSSTSDKPIVTSSKSSGDINSRDDSDAQLCKICLDAKLNTLFMPCRHLVACKSCAARIKGRHNPTCPMCRKPMKKYLEVYMI